MPGTRKLGRKTDHRMAMLKGMVTFLLENGKIETTLTRAKEVSALADKMITLGKENNLANYRRALAFIKKEDVAAVFGNTIKDLSTDSNIDVTITNDGAVVTGIKIAYTMKAFDNFPERSVEIEVTYGYNVEVVNIAQ